MAQIVAANSTRLTLYDTNSSTGVFADLFGLSDGVPGITVDGVDLTPDFAPSGVLSTDGIHPNPRGNALIVNEMIDVIEAKFGATLPKINVLNKSSISVCAGNCLSQQ
jgi:lysophospholipase L1-like esterase